MQITAILSTTVLPLDGVYSVRTLDAGERATLLTIGLDGVPHYCGHPDTKALIEAAGATPAPTKLFTGLQVGELAICVPIKQGMSSRAQDGFTVHQAISDLETLDIRLLERLS